MPPKLVEYSTEKRPGAPGKRTKPLSDRIKDFYGYVNKVGHPKGCFEWQASCLKSGGYGQFKINGTMWRAHVLAYTIEVGVVPDGMDVCHTCDNPKCVNVAHLELWSHRKNMEDMIAKKRDKHAFCAEHPSSTFTNEQVANVKAWILDGRYSRAELARKFGLDRSFVSKLANGVQWKQVTPATQLCEIAILKPKPTNVNE